MSSSRYIKHDDLMLSNNNKYNKKNNKKGTDDSYKQSFLYKK